MSGIDGRRAPAWLATALDGTPFDVRPVLAGGEDPFTVLMERADTVEFGEVLVVDAPFNPSPLRRVLGSQGFSSFAQRLSEGHWRVFFRRDGGGDWAAEADIVTEGALSWREDDGIHIDVRKLQPPQPMVAILSLIDGLPAPETLIVHHDRMPSFLIPELAERGWHIARVVEEMANIRLWLEVQS
jgi:uncharacterized protein (DUF2249 family)